MLVLHFDYDFTQHLMEYGSAVEVAGGVDAPEVVYSLFIEEVVVQQELQQRN